MAARYNSASSGGTPGRAGQARLASWLRQRRVRGYADIGARALTAAQAQRITLPGQDIAAGIISEIARSLLGLDQRVTELDAQIAAMFAQHPQAEIIQSMPAAVPGCAAGRRRGPRRPPEPGGRDRLSHRSRHQCTAGEFRAACRSLGITQSMGTAGDSYDNAMAESFLSGFKREVIDGENYATSADARKEIFTWLNWYNQTRLHTSIGNRPPVEYEHHLAQQSLVN
jgi:Integrase core domain